MVSSPMMHLNARILSALFALFSCVSMVWISMRRVCLAARPNDTHCGSTMSTKSRPGIGPLFALSRPHRTRTSSVSLRPPASSRAISHTAVSPSVTVGVTARMLMSATFSASSRGGSVVSSIVTSKSSLLLSTFVPTGLSMKAANASRPSSATSSRFVRRVSVFEVSLVPNRTVYVPAS